MLTGKKLARETLLPSVLEDSDAETECEREELGGPGRRPPRRPLTFFSRGSGDDQQTVDRAERDLRGPLGHGSASPGGVQDDGERGDEKEIEDGEKEKIEENGASDEDYDTDLELEDAYEAYDRTGQTCYIEACRVLQVVPASYYIRHMQNVELSMAHHGLGPQGTKALAVPLVTNTSIQSLNMQDNWMEGIGGAAMAEMLKENCYITEVDLSDNRLGERGARAVASMLLENTTLVSLSISGNHLGDQGAQQLGLALTTNTKLQYLDLSHNALGEPTGETFGDCLSENTGLRSLSLAWNSIRGRGAVMLAKGLGANIFLRALDLSFNGLGKEGAIALGVALKENNSLEELNISNNRIPPEGAVRLAVGLTENKTLQSLNMGQNPIQNAGCYGMLRCIQGNPQSSLETLDFSDITVNQDFEDLYTAVKEMFPTLTVKYGKLAC